MDLVIYGAQGIALGICEAIHCLYPLRRVRCFLVSKRGMNPEKLMGIPVIELENFSKLISEEEKKKIEILIATPENRMMEIEKNLDSYGLHGYVRLTSSRWAELMGYYYACRKEYTPLRVLPIGYHKAELHIFMAKFYRDKPLNSAFSMPAWIIPIQVGAALCKERVADIVDCDDENISVKNVNYSELTALYWIWKNVLEDSRGKDKLIYRNKGEKKVIQEKKEYFGLSHYRRVLELSEDDVLRLEDNDVDVVLPYPMPYEPDIEEHHKRYLADCDWKALLTALEELQPEYAHAFPAILHQQYFYNYNIILARKSVLREYCSWLFPILERIEQLSSPKGWERQDRYIGYMGETLETLYFMYNRNNLNIVHTGCKFLT